MSLATPRHATGRAPIHLPWQRAISASEPAELLISPPLCSRCRRLTAPAPPPPASPPRSVLPDLAHGSAARARPAQPAHWGAAVPAALRSVPWRAQGPRGRGRGRGRGPLHCTAEVGTCSEHATSLRAASTQAPPHTATRRPRPRRALRPEQAVCLPTLPRASRRPHTGTPADAHRHGSCRSCSSCTIRSFCAAPGGAVGLWSGAPLCIHAAGGCIHRADHGGGKIRRPPEPPQGTSSSGGGRGQIRFPHPGGSSRLCAKGRGTGGAGGAAGRAIQLAGSAPPRPT